jgi:pilus assembly protein CpaC
MRKTLERAIAALAITILSAAGTPALAGGDKVAKSASTAEQSNESLLVIPANARFPLTKRIGMGSGKSMIVQFPVALKDVLIADPTKMDAIVQSSNQVFLIGKTPGATNAFFFDQNGQQILTLEIAIGADMGGLESLLKRLLPGSNITLDAAGKSIVLTGTVRTPLDSARASDLAREFIRATKGLAGASTATAGPATGAPGQQSLSVTTASASAGNGGGSGHHQPAERRGRRAGSASRPCR